jgi:hypothetical protein
MSEEHTAEPVQTAPEPNPLQAQVTELAQRLGETERGPLRQIRLLIEGMGFDAVHAKIEETLAIEAQGGMLTADGQRRRTPGGVFFYIVKGAMDPELRAKIFPGFATRKKGTVLDWAERMELLEQLMQEPIGSVARMTVTLYGRPSQVATAEGNDSVVMILGQRVQREENVPYPRGVPEFPPQDVYYVVYAGLNSWEKVAKFMENPKDELIVTGILFYDPETGTQAVIAQGLTTREIERRQKRDAKIEEQRAAAKAAKEAQKAAKTGAPKAAGSSKPRPSAASLNIPESAPPEMVEKLQQLHQAAQTLQERIAAKEGKGQKADLEQKLLTNTQKQIEALMKQL